MPAMTSLQPATPATGTCALVVGNTPLDGRLRSLLRGSRWNLENATGIEEAIARLTKRPAAAVLCGAREWRDFLNAAWRRLEHPPVVLVLSTSPTDSEWMEVLEAGANYVDARNLDATGLFSLLNHAWRVWSKV
jgi:hypothetical protein